MNNFYPIEGNLFPLILMETSEPKEHSIATSIKDPNLAKKIEEMAKIFKRRDFNQVVIGIDDLTDIKTVLKIYKMFLEEDIFIVGIFTDYVKDEDMELLNSILKYGVILSDYGLFLKEDNSYKKTL